ncbi:MAG: hypothetical protein LAO05_07395 [Acidobacteriia bacterium]|nr:hypothetical protein [Terriglobia bacterium]
MNDEAAKAREARTLLERLGARVPGFSGYLERELRREVDQLLRAELASRLDTARASLAAYTRTLRPGAAGPLERLGSLDKSLDALANSVRHAGSGYGGLFDAVKVREEQLEVLYRLDLDLVESVDDVREAAVSLGSDDKVLARVEQAAAKVRAGLDRREGVVRGVFTQDGAGGGGR